MFSTTTLGQTQAESEGQVRGSAIHVTHVLGFEGARHNANGELRIQGHSLQFQQGRSPAAQVSISSIQNIFLGGEDKQVGGVPMMLGEAAVPFGGGRVVSLFSHKKYDSLTVEYLDNNGGFHGAIFRLSKGQAENFKKDLVTNGAHIGQDKAPTPSAPEVKNEPQQFMPGAVGESLTAGKNRGIQQWSVQVDRVDPGVANLEASFGVATYENLLDELSKTKQFKKVFRSGDRNANDIPDLLILKTTVQKYTPGSETRRAVTTVTGATKLNVRIQLVTREGHVVLEHAVEGDVRFIGSNLRATHNLAHNIAGTLKRSVMPEPEVLVPAQQTEKVSKYQTGTLAAVRPH
jgi:hypothetical protein